MARLDDRHANIAVPGAFLVLRLLIHVMYAPQGYHHGSRVVGAKLLQLVPANDTAERSSRIHPLSLKPRRASVERNLVVIVS